jgi:hypothetical protein
MRFPRTWGLPGFTPARGCEDEIRNFLKNLAFIAWMSASAPSPAAFHFRRITARSGIEWWPSRPPGVEGGRW